MTRDKKVILSPEQVLTAHQTIAASFGNQPETVVAQARQRAQTQHLIPEQMT